MYYHVFDEAPSMMTIPAAFLWSFWYLFFLGQTEAAVWPVSIHFLKYLDRFLGTTSNSSSSRGCFWLGNLGLWLGMWPGRSAVDHDVAATWISDFGPLELPLSSAHQTCDWCWSILQIRRLVAGLVAIFGIFAYIGLLSSSQLTKSYFAEGWPNHQPD